MELQVGVKIFIKNREGKYLLVRRSPEKYPEVGATWDIVGGRIDPGTTLLENLAREVKEETGLEIVGEPKLIAAQDILRIPEKHIVRLTYAGSAKGEVKLGDEHTEHAWHTIKEMKEMPNLDKYVRELLEKGIL
ncbi:MAG: hypothetical protein A2946_00515 [Candidatus Liptonbacteria bacterium RIFCSPLOWO2_01_FULL_53_13]|uniref:Nudix hydrolase domain-containing protein n=1 Tax=Candidatus Liptonbacteria bacterium RIFCSPLOWO2_01_FULL_53_13 TaxID=1798651 RepID=A0A1G2CGF5_9BACT|nr:MAG: hypothetical protein A2946_00515 [Candidatus Liptonbacteria bacterium RIFCSPLOWO2_01_FULL_53_13]